METSNRKQKMKAQAISLIRLLFAHRANGSLSFVHFVTEKQKEIIRRQICRLNGLNRLAHLHQPAANIRQVRTSSTQCSQRKRAEVQLYCHSLCSWQAIANKLLYHHSSWSSTLIAWPWMAEHGCCVRHVAE
jgi:hypothetical protein